MRVNRRRGGKVSLIGSCNKPVAASTLIEQIHRKSGSATVLNIVEGSIERIAPDPVVSGENDEIHICIAGAAGNLAFWFCQGVSDDSRCQRSRGFRRREDPKR